MAVITFTSDLGTRDFYVAAVKGAILTETKTLLPIIDVTHEIRHFDIRQAAYTVANAYPYFPKGSIHIIHVSGAMTGSKLLLCEADGHYFLTFDSGLLSLMFPVKPHKVYLVNEELAENRTLLCEKQIAHVVTLLLQEFLPKDFAQPYGDAETFRHLQPVSNRGSLRGSVIHIDHYGNAISNITKEMVLEFTAGKRFAVHASTNHVVGISNSYHEVEEGEMVCIFNTAGYLEIGICKGKAEHLLGLRMDSPVLVIAD